VDARPEAVHTDDSIADLWLPTEEYGPVLLHQQLFRYAIPILSNPCANRYPVVAVEHRAVELRLGDIQLRNKRRVLVWCWLLNSHRLLWLPGNCMQRACS
jgi:hypothetical protein